MHSSAQKYLLAPVSQGTHPAHNFQTANLSLGALLHDTCFIQTASSGGLSSGKPNPFGNAKQRDERAVFQSKKDALQKEIDAASAAIDEIGEKDVPGKAEVEAALTAKTKKMEDLVKNFGAINVGSSNVAPAQERSTGAPRSEPRKFERPSERRARLERERSGDSSGYGGAYLQERQGDFSSFGSSGGDGREGRPGDWTCPRCQANVFASKSACFKCGEPRPTDQREGGSYGGSGGGYERQGDFSSFGNRDGGGSRPGDWECPSCGANVFASKSHCFKCQTPRPGGGGGMEGSYNTSGGDFSSFNSGGRRGGYDRDGGSYGEVGGGYEPRPGDWECPSCGANVFASKDNCFKCGYAR